MSDGMFARTAAIIGASFRAGITTATVFPPIIWANSSIACLIITPVRGTPFEAGPYPSRLSGGQKQRVAIARALANRPRLILADEPTAALDEHSGRHVVNLLKKLAQEEGCTSLIVTHDSRVFGFGDRIAHMDDGRIVDVQDQGRARDTLLEALSPEGRDALLAWVQTTRRGMTAYVPVNEL